MPYSKQLERMGISPAVYAFCCAVEDELADRYRKLDHILENNQLKVLEAMQQHQIAERHFESSTGYGYNDDGRDALEAVYASVFGTEDALVRPQMISGTHALSTALFACLRPGDEVVFATGLPYDTLQGVVGIRPEKGSLAEFNVTYKIVELGEDGMPDLEAIRAAITEKTKMVAMQRSKGYSFRHSFSVEELGEVIRVVKEAKPDVITMVDNCYGEFTQEIEPPQVGADLTVGSLIKNPGGGLAPIGGYICGPTELVELCAVRLTTPGIGKEAGATLGVNRSLYQGFFLSPQVTNSAVKTAMLAASVFNKLGYATSPAADEDHYDIVEAIALEKPEGVLAFCRGIQWAAPVDSNVTPEPWDMPGYDCPVIMAAGAFISGSSIELSADGPMKPPYIVYFQGGLTYSHGRYGIMKALQEMVNDGLVKFE